jgi:hypothetical protein
MDNQHDAREALKQLAEKVLEEWDWYERRGAVSRLEGSPLIHASTLEDLAELARTALATPPAEPAQPSKSSLKDEYRKGYDHGWAEGYAYGSNGSI